MVRPRMRTLRKAFNEILENDPNTAITYNGLRLAVLNNEIPSIKRGNRLLIDLNKVDAYYSNELDG